jgi:hypothetical protein
MVGEQIVPYEGEEKKTTEYAERRRKDTEKELVSVYSVVFFSSLLFSLYSVKSAALALVNSAAPIHHPQRQTGTTSTQETSTVER